MNRFALFALLALPAVVTPTTSHAQVAAPLAVRAHDNARPSPGGQPRSAERSSYEMPSRVLLGVGGAVAGAMGGALFGAHVLYQGGCACEDPGLGEAVLSAAVGSVLASAALASIPNFNNRCGYASRVGLGVAGSIVGALVGGVVGSRVDGSGVYGSGALQGYMGGAGLGAGVASTFCKG